MTKKMLFIFLFALFFHGCNEHIPVENNDNMNTENFSAQNNSSYLLTVEKAKQALLRMMNERDAKNLALLERIDEIKKQNPDWRPSYDSGLYGFAVEKFEDYENVDFDKLFDEYVVIEIKNRENFEDNGNWECDLKAGWFRKSTSTEYFSNTVTGRFRKDKNDEWVATIEWFEGGDRMP